MGTKMMSSEWNETAFLTEMERESERERERETGCVKNSLVFN